MDDPSFEILNVADARRVLTGGDIRTDVAFQNDINRLLASLDDLWDVAEPRLAGAPSARQQGRASDRQSEEAPPARAA
jgi:hypothetical protein